MKLTPELRRILADHPHVPALFGAIVDHGRLTALGAAGRRSVDAPVAVSADDLVHLGSDTRAMTALLVAQLVQARQLCWTDAVGTLFPDLRPAMNADAAGVTVTELLRHTAGLPHDLKWRALAATGQPVPGERLAAVREALSAVPLLPPGHRYAYSNVGYVILGAIVERRAGQPWERVVADRIFGPLGMTTAGFGPPGTAGQTDQPWGHRTVDGRLVPSQSDNPPVMGPAGCVHCSMADWGRFVCQFCRQPGRRDPGPGGRADPGRADATPASGGTYAGGWLRVDRGWAGGRALTHAGSNTMWYCVAWVAPARGFAVLAAGNTGDPDAPAACDAVAAALIHRRPPVR